MSLRHSVESLRLRLLEVCLRFAYIVGLARFGLTLCADCYVAVTGLPEPMKDHALVMARFARDCIEKMNDLTKKLEVALGPDTGDLCLRIGECRLLPNMCAVRRLTSSKRSPQWSCDSRSAPR